MDPIIKILEEEPLNSDLLLKSLTNFNSDNNASLTFADRFGLDQKRRFVKDLVSVLKKDDTDKFLNESVRPAILQALRLCSRESAGLTELGENTKLIMRLASLHEPEAPSTSTSDEAAKLLVNMLAKIDGSSAQFVQEGGLEKIIQRIKISDVTMPRMFPLCRTLFHLSLKPDNVEELQKYNALDTIIRHLDAGLNNPDADQTTISDLTKLVFNLTLHLGPLSDRKRAPTSEEEEQMKRLFPIFEKILNLPTVESSQIPSDLLVPGKVADARYQLKLSMLNCLINIPPHMISNVSTVAAVDNLLEILKIQLKTEPNAEGLVTILMVLSGVAKAVPSLRHHMKDIIYPPADKQSEDVNVDAPKDEGYLSFVIRKHMTSANVALKHYAQEFLFILCDEDGKEFARLNGVGPGAGLLAERNLLSVMTQLAGKPVSNTNPPSQSSRVQELNSDDSEDENSEDEREAEQLAEKMMRLEQLGVFKRMDGKK